MAFKKQFTCGCDALNCKAEIVVWAISPFSAYKELLDKGWFIKPYPKYNATFMYCPIHGDSEPNLY